MELLIRAQNCLRSPRSGRGRRGKLFFLSVEDPVNSTEEIPTNQNLPAPLEKCPGLDILYRWMSQRK